MKNKFLKVLTIGAVCCVGALSLTGCSVDMSDAQVNKLMETVETVTKDFGDLTDTIGDMQKTIDELNEQLSKQTKDEILSIVSQAQCNMVLNRKEYMKNCKVTARSETMGFLYQGYYFVTPGGIRSYVVKIKEEDEDTTYYKVIYAENDSKTYVYNSKIDKKEEIATSFDVTIQSESAFNDGFSYIMLSSKQAEEMYRSFAIDDNNDYVVKFIDESFLSGSEESHTSPRITQLEFTISSKDTTVKQITINEAVLSAQEGDETVNTSQTITTEIGGVKESDISAMLSAAIAKSVG